MSSAERVAQNESLFRHVNERVEDTALRWGIAESGFEIVCECDRMDCEARIQISVPEYEAVRRDPRQFIVLAEHKEESGTEVEVRQGSGYLVVRKVGEAGKVAEQLAERD